MSLVASKFLGFSLYGIKDTKAKTIEKRKVFDINFLGDLYSKFSKNDNPNFLVITFKIDKNSSLYFSNRIKIANMNNIAAVNLVANARPKKEAAKMRFLVPLDL